MLKDDIKNELAIRFGLDSKELVFLAGVGKTAMELFLPQIKMVRNWCLKYHRLLTKCT